MALQHTIVSEVGVSTNYHKIQSIVVSKIDDNKYNVSYTLFSYADKSYRDKHESLNIDMTCGSFIINKSELSTNLFTLVYNELKKSERFKGSIDV